MRLLKTDDYSLDLERLEHGPKILPILWHIPGPTSIKGIEMVGYKEHA